MPAVIKDILATTELEAVNTMLGSIGEAQLPSATDLSTATQTDVTLAKNILLNACREVQTLGWRFNTEYGVEVPPDATFSWVDTDGATTLLNIFHVPLTVQVAGVGLRPTGMIRWKQTECVENLGLDLVARPSKRYTSAAATRLVFYDRYKNRDGPAAADYPYIYIDAVYAFDFEKLPEEARRYIAVLASRRFSQQALGSQTLSSFTERDEMFALRTLKREQGLPEKLNMRNTSHSMSIHGWRPLPFSGFSRKTYPGSST